MSRLAPGVLRLVAVMLGGGLAILVGPTMAAAMPSTPLDRPPVILVAVPGLQWSDVADMPHLAGLVRRGAVGELVVKTAGSVTRCQAGLLAVSAGNRTQAPGASTGCSLPPGAWLSLAARNQHSRYRARLGSLGIALQSAGLSTVAVGAAAVPMLADAGGTVDKTVGSLSAAPRTGGVIAILDSALYDVGAQPRPAVRQLVDSRLGAVESALPAAATLIVAGTSDAATGGATLHPVVVVGPGWQHVELHSSAGGRVPYVQLIDLAPTILSIEGAPIPADVAGRPMLQSGHAVPAISSFVEDNNHAVREVTLGQRTFLIVGILAIVVMCMATVPSSHLRRAGVWLARLVAPAPVMMFVANGVPWWRWGDWSYGVVLVVGCIALAVLTTVVIRSRHWAGLVVVPAVAFAVLILDQLAGAHLQLSAPLGDNPLIAGRFRGMGNIDFAVMATSALVVAGVVGGRLRRGAGLATAGVILLIAIVVDGAPRLGDDLGGVVSLLPAAVVVLALVARVRLNWIRAVGIAVVTAIVALAVALADYSRPATSQTHVGRFVGQVLHGGAGTEVRRKVDAVVGSFGGTVGTVLVIVALALAVVNHRRVRAAATATPGVTASTAAIVVLGLVGAALNDSGVTIAAMVTIVGFMALYGAGPALAPTPGRDAADGD